MEDALALVSHLRFSSLSLEALDPTMLKLVLAGIGIFLFLVLFAFTRHHLIHTAMHGLGVGLIIGVGITLAVEGSGYYFYRNYVVGEGSSTLPENFQVVLHDTTQGVTKVLGDKIEKKVLTAKEVVSEYRSLDATDSELAHTAICKDAETKQ